MNPRPQFNMSISIGNILTIVSALVLSGIAYQGLRANDTALLTALESQGKNLSEMQLDVANQLSKAALDRAQHESRIRYLERSDARSDERYNSIIQRLDRISETLVTNYKRYVPQEESVPR